MLNALVKPKGKPGTALKEANAAGQHQRNVRRAVKVLNEHADWRKKYSDLADRLHTESSQKIQHIAAATLIAMRNQEKYLATLPKHLLESTTSSALGPIAPRIIDIVRIFFPNLIANYIAEIQPMDRRVGQLLVVKPRFSNTAAGVTAGQEVFVNRTDGSYSSDIQNQTVDTGDGVTTNFTGSASLTPIRPATFQVLVDGTVVGQDNGSGTIVGPGIAAGTISYANGSFDITFTAAATPGAGAVITITYRWDIEQNPVGIRKLQLGMNLVPIVAQPHPLQVEWTVEAALAAEAEFNFDVQQNSTEVTAFFIKQERDRQLSNLIFAAAQPETTLNFNAATPAPELTKRQHFQDFSLKLTEAERIIFARNNRGKVSFFLCGRNVASLISQQADFVKDKVDVPIGAYKLGTWKGEVDVIFDPAAPDNDYVAGFRGMVLGDAALILGEWIPLYLTPTFQAPTFINTQGMLSMYGTLMNNSGYYCKGSITGYTA